MRNRLCAVAVALALMTATAGAQDADPLDGAFFKPLDPAPAGALADAVVPSVAECRPGCPPQFTTWFAGEWLIGRARGVGLVPVVTTGPASAGLLAGAVGQPTTAPLFGGNRVLTDWRSGLRVEAGVWFDPDHTTGASARFYSLFSATDRLSLRPDGTAVVDVPQFVPAGGAVVQFPAFVGYPGAASGRVDAVARTTFLGGDLNLRRLLGRNDAGRVELLAGYRHLYLSDELTSSFAANPVGLALAPRVSGGDVLHSRNNFAGPQLGLYASTGGARFLLEGHAATALGVTAADIDYARARTISAGVNPLATAAALVALGVPAVTAAQVAALANQPVATQTALSDTRTYFGVVGEGGVRAKWFVTDHVRLTAGYSFLYWNNVRRGTGEFTNTGALNPRATDFTTHLFNVGMEVRY